MGLLDRFPVLRRHPHPMVVHFPIVFAISPVLFYLLYRLSGAAAGPRVFGLLTIRFVAEMPPHVCLNEIVISPTWNRMLLGGREISLAPKIEK